MPDAPTRVVVVWFPRWAALCASLGRGARGAFEPVVRSIVEHVPLVEVVAPGVVMFATRGPSRRVGGDSRLAALVHDAAGDALRSTIGGANPSAIDPSHLVFGVGVADGRLASGIAARRAAAAGEPVVVPPGTAGPWLAAMPVRSLVECVEVVGRVGRGVPGTDDVRSYRDLVSLLERLGLHRLGDVAALAESDLIARLGAFGRDVSRLSRGLDRHPPLVVEPPPERVRFLRFEGPVESRDAVVSAIGELSVQLVDHLRAQGLLMVRLHVLVESDHGERSERMWYRAEGFGARAIVETLRWQLDAWILHDAPTSGVVAVRLSPEQFVVEGGRQSALWGGEREGDRHARRALGRVTDLIGADSVTLPAWRGDRDPARSFEFVRSDTVDLERRAAGDVVDLSVGDWRGALPSPSPSLVFDVSSPGTPEIRVLDARGRPLTVDARHAMSGDPAGVYVGDRHHEVVAWAGPWPVEERWWDAVRARRAVRLQLLVRRPPRDGRITALVAVLERGVWRLAAWYA